MDDYLKIWDSRDMPPDVQAGCGGESYVFALPGAIKALIVASS